MIASTVIGRATADGLKLTVAPGGGLNVAGDGATVERWAPVLREHKADIIAELRPLEAVAIIEAHGYRFAVATVEGAAFVPGCVNLDPREVRQLVEASGGARLSHDMVEAIARVKLHFPGAKVENMEGR